MLELVRRDDAVPPLVTGFVHRDPFRRGDAARRDPARARREQRRILHPARVAVPRGIDDRDVAVRIRTVPLAVVLQRRARRVEVPVGLARMLRLQQQAHVDRRQRRMLEPGAALDESGLVVHAKSWTSS